MVYIICILPYKYYMVMMYNYGYVYGYLNLFLLGGRGVSIIDIKVCTFSIGVNSFMISSIDFMVILCFGGISSFSTQILSIGTSGIFLRYWGLWPLCRLGHSPSVEYILCDLLRCSFLWLHPFLAECKILKCLSWLYLLMVMNTSCDLNPFLLMVCSYLIWLICLSR